MRVGLLRTCLASRTGVACFDRKCDLKSASAESLLQKTWTSLCSDTIVHSKILKYLIGKKSIEHDWAGMRDPREKRSSLKYPLDDILGSPGVVRLLRVLFHEAFAPVGVADSAAKA